MGPSCVERLRIWGFRGVREADLRFGKNCVLVGPNGCGKSTIIDALSLVLGRAKMVRALTEHDFYGSDPAAPARIRIVATLGGFDGDDDADHDDWFRNGRGVPKWVSVDGVEHAEAATGRRLVVNIGFAARFDQEELEVDVARYFHDADDATDPFNDDGALMPVPYRLLNEVGYFVLPARRSWDGVASFNSDLFRRTISNAAGIPSDEVLQQRDRLRKPEARIEDSPKLAALVTGINARLARLIVGAPRFQLRVTAGDAEGVLQALLPHYEAASGTALPAARHGTGLVSLQSMLLLLEVGKARREKGLPFVLALEEPELHLAPGLHGRLVAEAIGLADQVIATTHSPDVARVFDATATSLVTNTAGTLRASLFLRAPLPATATNQDRKLYIQNRTRVVEALMYPVVLVPEGRFDAEWLGRLAAIAEASIGANAPFRTVFGIVPTEDAAVRFTVERLRPLRGGVVALVDGDGAGDGYVLELLALAAPPDVILQWPPGWTIEDVVRWALAGDESLLAAVQAALPACSFATLDALRDLLRTSNNSKKGIVGLKEDVIAHESILGVLEQSVPCVRRVVTLCDAMVAVGTGGASPAMTVDARTTDTCKVYRFQP